MRVVLDANVFLSALISPHGAPDIIYQAWRARRFELVTSTVQLDELYYELLRVSNYPKLRAILPMHRIGAMVKNMHRSVVLEHLPNLPDGVELIDPSDDFLFTMALAGEADYLVTGDRRAGLLQRGSAGRARIVSPTTFCAEAL